MGTCGALCRVAWTCCASLQYFADFWTPVCGLMSQIRTPLVPFVNQNIPVLAPRTSCLEPKILHPDAPRPNSRLLGA